MNPVVLTAAPSITDWITAISTAVLALSVLGAALGWTRRQARELGDPGEPPGGSKGELKEIIEDVGRDEVGDRTYRKGFRKLVRDRHKSQPRKVRWQRYLRRRNRRREARKRNTADQQPAVSESPPPERARPEQEGGPG